jgi:SAM-dependent methyltransferase
MLMSPDSLRALRGDEIDPATLAPGDHHYMAYVGPPGQYDFMGATQFALLFTLGLRARHRFLDFGCGSLRAGRLLIPYLDPGCYFGIDPNRWLIEDAIRNEIGDDMIRIKRPAFDYNDRFDAQCFGVRFDFVVAQSIFSHAGPESIMRSLRSISGALGPGGLLAVTFIEGEADHEGDEWVYPEVVSYRRATIESFAVEAGLAITPIPWFHPRQSWFLCASDSARLPDEEMKAHLEGAVLFDPEFRASVGGADGAGNQSASP